MNLTKSLAVRAFFFANIFISSISVYSTYSSTKKPTHIAPQETRGINLVNLTDYDFFVSVKKNGHFIQDMHVIHGDKRDGDDSLLSKKKLPPYSFGSILFYEEDYLKNITFRIWLTKEEKPTNSYVRKPTKKYVTFSILPQILAGLQVITICIEDEYIIEYIHHDFTDGFKCGICKRTFANEDKNLVVLECGCVLHQSCFSLITRTTECPHCHYLISRHEFQNFPCIYDSRFIIGSISQDNFNLINLRSTAKKIPNYSHATRTK